MRNAERQRSWGISIGGLANDEGESLDEREMEEWETRREKRRRKDADDNLERIPGPDPNSYIFYPTNAPDTTSSIPPYYVKPANPDRL